jgi:hypothetical protein
VLGSCHGIELKLMEDTIGFGTGRNYYSFIFIELKEN